MITAETQTPASEAEQRSTHLTGARGLAMKAEKLMREAGRDQLAGDLRRGVDSAMGREAMVVVAGETNRGKSSLINALLDRPGLLPVSDDVSTSVHTVVRRVDGPDCAQVSRLDGSHVDIPISELHRWVEGDEPEREEISRVDVWVDHPLLDGLALIDTPGLGGLSAAHGRAAQAGLELAAALIFVGDAGSPLSAIELEFLERATERTGLILLAVNRSDAHLGAEEIAEEDRELLRRRLPAASTMTLLPISAEMKLRGDRHALQSGEDSLTEDLRRDSGVDALRGALEEWAANQGSMLRVGMVCQVTESAVSRMLTVAKKTLEGLSDDARDRERRLAQAQRGRQQLERAGRVARRRLSEAIGALPREIDLKISGSMAALRREIEKEIGGRKKRELESEVMSELQRITEEIMTMLGERTAKALEDAVEPLRGYGVETSASLDAREHLPIEVDSSEPGKRNVDPKELLVGAPLIVVGLATGALPLALAGATGVLIRGFQLFDRSRRSQVMETLTDVVAEYQRRLSLVVHQALQEQRSATTTALDEAIEQRQADLVSEIEALKTLGRRSSNDRAAQRQELEREIASAGDLLRRVQGLRIAATAAATPQDPATAQMGMRA